jgi:hypothetical protein
VREESRYPDISTPEAVDGTGSHLLLELCLKNPTQPVEHYLDKTIGERHEDRPQGWWVKSDRIKRVRIMLDYINRRIHELGGNVTIESESLSNPGTLYQRDDWWGTTDVTLRTPEVLEIIDLKDGQLYVSEKDNIQLIGNAIGKMGNHPRARDENDIVYESLKTVRMTIVQPKTTTPIRYIEMTPTKLWGWGMKLYKAAQATDDPNAPLLNGPWCRWCKHGRAGNCDTKNKKAMEGINLMTNANNDGMIDALQIGQINPADMTNERIASILDATPLILKLLENVDNEAMKRLKAGQIVPGYGIGKGKGSTKFKDPEEVVWNKLKGLRVKKSDVYKNVFITPPQALKLKLNKKQLEKVKEMIKTVPGKDKVVKSNQAPQMSVDEMFPMETPTDQTAEGTGQPAEELNFM